MYIHIYIHTCIHIYIYIYYIILYICIYIYIYNLIQIIQNSKFCYLKFRTMNDDFQAILNFSHNSNMLILDKFDMLSMLS